ncbi:MAG: hypothetical protein ACOCR6_00520 [archaeon]
MFSITITNETREQQFEKHLHQTRFEPIRDRVEFFDFEAVSRLHAATDKANGIVQRLQT